MNKPLTRVGAYLGKLVGLPVAVPAYPITRIETYLAWLCGQDVTLPNYPITRVEQYLAKICENGGGSAPVLEELTITENGTYTPGEGVDGFSSVVANVQGGAGNPAVATNEVNFIDYDGTVLYSYTVAEAQALTELPPLPEHDGLICQGWNWSLEEIQAMGRDVIVGAMYITDDGKTRLYIQIYSKEYMDVHLYFAQSVANGVTVDWGDGSPTQTKSDTSWSGLYHDYSSLGDYVITLEPIGECELELLGSSGRQVCIFGPVSYSSRERGKKLKKVNIGRGVTSIGESAFRGCERMESITIPQNVRSIGDGALKECTYLRSVTIPKYVTSMGYNACVSGYSLFSISMPSGMAEIGRYACYECANLAFVTIPDGVASIGQYAFSGLDNLSIITIPASLEGIDSDVFYNNYGIRKVDFKGTPSYINSIAFRNGDNITTIRVPWSEGAVANAPWGAVNATIIYDWNGEE